MFGEKRGDLENRIRELFGGFAPRFYHAYRESGLIDEGYETRRDIYNLYHLLNHLNIF
ncbi:MAG: fructosamine kinase family protein, partial [Lachnospiraceae bacterium]|nr:fructosamine kinase family protein [Lachnospiraceae bacterium]